MEEWNNISKDKIRERTLAKMKADEELTERRRKQLAQEDEGVKLIVEVVEKESAFAGANKKVITLRCGKCRKSISTKYYNYCPYCGTKINRGGK